MEPKPQFLGTASKIFPLALPKGTEKLCELCQRRAHLQCTKCRVTFYWWGRLALFLQGTLALFCSVFLFLFLQFTVHLLDKVFFPNPTVLRSFCVVVICVCGLDVRWQCWRYFSPQPNSQRTALCMYLWLTPRWVGVGGTSANWITTYNYFWSRDNCGSTACACTMLFSWSAWTLIPYLWRRLEPLQALLQIINCGWVKSSLAQCMEWRRACGDIPPRRDLCKGMSL